MTRMVVAARTAVITVVVVVSVVSLEYSSVFAAVDN